MLYSTGKKKGGLKGRPFGYPLLEEVLEVRPDGPRVLH
jgi:hypothetical protein